MIYTGRTYWSKSITCHILTARAGDGPSLCGIRTADLGDGATLESVEGQEEYICKRCLKALRKKVSE
jgi:hypothetical protein